MKNDEWLLIRKIALCCVVTSLAACQMAATGGDAEKQGMVLEPWVGALPVGIDRGLPNDFREEDAFFNTTNKCFYYVNNGKIMRVPDDPETGKPACIRES